MKLPEIFSLNSRKFFRLKFSEFNNPLKGDFLFHFCLKTFFEKKYFDLDSKCSKLGPVFYLGEISSNNHLVRNYFFNGLKGT